jgi:hypothetical protein
MYGSLTVDPTGLPWLLTTAPQPPDVVANVEQNIYNILEEKDIFSLYNKEWLNGNVINFVLDRLVHLQTSQMYTCKLIYLYDTRFSPANLAQDPIQLSRISRHSLSPIRPYTKSQRRGGGALYQNENVLDPSMYKLVFLPRHNGTVHWQFVLLVPGLRRVYFGDSYGITSESPGLTRGFVGSVLDQVEKFIEMYVRHHGRRWVNQRWTRHWFFHREVQDDSCSCGLFLLPVPFLLIQLLILCPSCGEQSLIEHVRNVAVDMRFGNSPNAEKMQNWVMFALATNQIVPNGNQVATRSMPALGQPIPVYDDLLSKISV